jgi:thioredoxin reductase (NADPH)
VGNPGVGFVFHGILSSRHSGLEPESIFFLKVMFKKMDAGSKPGMTALGENNNFEQRFLLCIHYPCFKPQRQMDVPQSSMNVSNYTTDVAIIGAGPVGLFAVFELGMLKIKAHVIDTLPALGGQCTALYPEKPIYDIPGYPSIDAQDLIKKLEQQAAPFAPVYHLGQQVVSLKKLESGIWNLETSTGTRIQCKAVIIAAGCGAFGPNRPPLEGIETFEGTSVHYMVTRREDFRDAEIVIAGGGDSAVDWANSLADVAKKIYFVHRRDKFRAMPESVEKMQALAAAGKIEFVVPYQLEGLVGESSSRMEDSPPAPPQAGGIKAPRPIRASGETSTVPSQHIVERDIEKESPPLAGGQGGNGSTRLKAVKVKSMDGTVREIAAQHLLAFFGLSMELGPIADWGLNLTNKHIAIDRGTSETSAKGIFAIGDIATYEHKLKLILCGFAEAAQAAHAIRDIIYPGVAHHFEYSTTKGVPV